MNKGTPADPLREALAALDLLLDGVDFRGLPRNSGWRVARRAANNARAALATKPAETPVSYSGTVHDGRLTVYANGDDVWSCAWPEHPTESAGKSPEAAGVGPIAYADQIAFESAMKAGKGCDVWPEAGDYEERTGRKLVALYRRNLAETQRSSNANGSDEQTSPSVQPPAPEPLRDALKDAIDCVEEHVQFVKGSLMDVTVKKWKRIAFSPSIAQRGAALTDEPTEKTLKAMMTAYWPGRFGATHDCWGRLELEQMRAVYEVVARALSPERPE